MPTRRIRLEKDGRPKKFKDDTVVLTYTVYDPENYERIYGRNPENYEKIFRTVKTTSDSSSKQNI